MSSAHTPAFVHAEQRVPARATPADAFIRAREIVHAGERLDMVALAADLGVARATLYRWTGDRERLLSDILWADVRSLLEHVFDTSPERGLDLVQAISVRFLGAVTAGDQLSTFLRLEGETGFRLITDPRGGVRPRIVELIAERIRREVDEGFYRAPEDPQLLAEGVVTLGERFLYHGGNPTANPDPVTAHRIIALLMREGDL